MTSPIPCLPLDPVCGASLAAKSVASGALKDLADAMVSGMGTASTSVATLWVDVPTGTVVASPGGTPVDTVAFIQNSLAWLTAFLAVLSILIGAAAMIWEQRAEPARAMGKAVLTLILVNGLGLAVIATSLVMFDAYSTWVLARSAGSNFGHNLMDLVGLGTGGSGAGDVLGPILLIICIGLGILVLIVQIILMTFRRAMLLLLAGVLPTSAAITNTRLGRQWFDRVAGWTLAFIVYKPTAATIYATAFRELNGTGGDQLVHTVNGLALMTLAVFALPALMRWFVPVVSHLSTGHGGGGMAGVVLAALPVGAQVLSLPRGGTPPPAPPTGATLPGGAARFAGAGAGAGAAGAAVGAASAAGSAVQRGATNTVGGPQ